MKKVNPKSIRISDEIEKRLKRGVIVIFGFAEDSKLARSKLIRITCLTLMFIPNDYRVSLTEQIENTWGQLHNRIIILSFE